VGIAAYATSHADFLPALPESNGTPNFNMALPLLFLLELPDGLKGVAIVGVMAAAMSSLDSVINSLSAVTMEDFVKRCGWASMVSELAEIRWSKALTAFWGLLAIVLAFWVDDIASTVLVAVNKLGSLINGPLLAVFVMGLLTKRATGLGVKVGFAVGFMSNAGLWLGAPEVSWLWWNVSGFMVAVVVGLIVSRRSPVPSPQSDVVWTLAFLRAEGFDLQWSIRYAALISGAGVFLIVLVLLGVR
ncbi:MAG: sodium:proline symporter, partial [Pseudomonadota bacterium]|nr:sodium:proline symporter [Pseudomonadota bacterium]